VLKSKSNSKYYIGYSSDPKARLIAHNTGMVKATKNRGPWEIIFTELFDSKKLAIQREHQIKSWKSREAIERLLFSK